MHSDLTKANAFVVRTELIVEVKGFPGSQLFCNKVNQQRILEYTTTESQMFGIIVVADLFDHVDQ
jgi:hypothetical protein